MEHSYVGLLDDTFKNVVDCIEIKIKIYCLLVL